MNFENDMFMQQKHRAMQAELAEAAAEGKELIDNNPSSITNVPVFTGEIGFMIVFRTMPYERLICKTLETLPPVHMIRD